MTVTGSAGHRAQAEGGTERAVACLGGPAQTSAWYGIRTRSNFEKTSAQVLSAKGYESYLPLYRTRKRWSDRVVETELPLFSGYVFCRFDAIERLPILTTPGVMSIVSAGKIPFPIPEEEIAAIQAALASGSAVKPCPYLKEGQRVRIEQGALEGVEGMLVREKSDWRVVLSIELLQRAVSVEVDRDWVTAL